MKIIPIRVSIGLLTLLVASLPVAADELKELAATNPEIRTTLVALSLETPQGKQTEVTVPDLGLATYTMTVSGQRALLGLQPRLSGEHIELSLYLTQEDEDTVRQLERVRLVLGESQIVRVLEQSLFVEANIEPASVSSLDASTSSLSSTSRCSFSVTQSDSFGFLHQAAGTCCTSCGSDSVCGCKVSDDCGNTCCAGICC